MGLLGLLSHQRPIFLAFEKVVKEVHDRMMLF
jgi:hypothetical protein